MTSFSNVTVDAKANVYFDGQVVSHVVHFPDGSRKSLGLIFPGTYHFDTASPERMEIVAGASTVVLDGTTDTLAMEAGASFEVAGASGFTITVADDTCEYVCSYL